MQKNYSLKGGIATLKLNKSVYPKQVLTQSCYVKLDDFYFLVDQGEEYYIIDMKPKKKMKNEELEEAVLAFFDELIESQSYIDQLKRTSEIRQTILERALLTQQVAEQNNESPQ